VLDFTKIVLENGRATCFAIVEVVKLKDADLEYHYYDYLMKGGKATAGYAMQALSVQKKKKEEKKK
jgi:hypothetical protein